MNEGLNYGPDGSCKNKTKPNHQGLASNLDITKIHPMKYVGTFTKYQVFEQSPGNSFNIRVCFASCILPWLKKKKPWPSVLHDLFSFCPSTPSKTSAENETASYYQLNWNMPFQLKLKFLMIELIFWLTIAGEEEWAPSDIEGKPKTLSDKQTKNLGKFIRMDNRQILY